MLPKPADPRSDIGAGLMLGEVREQLFGRALLTKVDRFIIRGVLGRGAFGSVFEAEDDRLGRRVAVKVLHRRPESADDEINRRFLREARALAQLSHPNVVEVYAAGSHHGRVWLAMELVAGQSLKEWIADNPAKAGQAPDRARQLLREAGAGLHAAHLAGIVHRDFKPANVLVGDDGRVRVADFGLARLSTDAPSTPATSSHDAHSGDTDRLTRTGAVMGTPRYMSPEQIDGANADARSDQFSFAVTAWEMLSGTLPFRGKSLPQLAAAIEGVELHGGDSMPRGVRRALTRALHPNPAARHASVEALLHAMDTGAPVLPAAGGFAVLAAGVSLAVLVPGQGDGAPPCNLASAQAQYGAVATAARRVEIEQRLREAMPAAAETMLPRITAVLDAHRESWVDTRSAACNAAADRVRLCLRDNLQLTGRVLDKLARPTPVLAARALTTVESLPAPDRCTHEGGNEAVTDPTLAAELNEIRAAGLAYDNPTVEARAERLAALAGNLGETGVVAESLALLGRARAQRLDSRGIEPLAEAHALAMTLDRPALAAASASRLARLYASVAAGDQAYLWIRHAESALARISSPTAAEVTEVHKGRCWVEHEVDGSAAAVDSCERWLQSAREAGGKAEIDAQRVLAMEYRDLGRTEEARELLEGLVEAATERWGRMHGETALAIEAQSDFAAAVMDADGAIERMLEAIEITEAVEGPDARVLAKRYGTLAHYHSYVGERDEAAAAFENSLRLLDLDTTLDPTRAEMERCQTLNSYAESMAEGGDYPGAIEMLRNVAVRQQAILPDDHAQNVTTQFTLGRVLLAAGDHAEASNKLSVARRWLRDHGHPRLAEAAFTHGLALLGNEERTTARAAFKEAAALAGEGRPSEAVLAARLALAKMTLEDGDDVAAESMVAEVEGHDAGPDDPPGAARAMAMHVRATIAADRGQMDEARTQFKAAQEAIGIDRNDPFFVVLRRSNAALAERLGMR